jgi:hypothetical protein
VLRRFWKRQSPAFQIDYLVEDLIPLASINATARVVRSKRRVWRRLESCDCPSDRGRRAAQMPRCLGKALVVCYSGEDHQIVEAAQHVVA